MTYEELVEINEQHKNNYKTKLANIVGKESDYKLIKDSCKFRLTYIENKWFVTNTVTKVALPFNNLSDVVDFYSMHKLAYITNLSEINNAKNSYVYNRYDMFGSEYDEIIDYLRNGMDTNLDVLDNIVLKRISNLKSYVGKLVLKGGIILWQNDNRLIFPNIVLVKLKTNLYLLSDCRINFRDEMRRKLEKDGILSHLRCKKLYVDNLDISSLESLRKGFAYSKYLEEIELRNFDTRNIKTMEGLFYECSELKKVNLDIFDTKNVLTFSVMFCGCKSIKNLDLSTFETNSLEDTSGMFRNCFNLENLDISSWNLENLNNAMVMFDECNSIKEIKGIENLKKVESTKNELMGNCKYTRKREFRG